MTDKKPIKPRPNDRAKGEDEEQAVMHPGFREDGPKGALRSTRKPVRPQGT
jgi:hypothetical protein